MGADPKNWLFPLTWGVTFTTARALPSSAVICTTESHGSNFNKNTNLNHFIHRYEIKKNSTILISYRKKHIFHTKSKTGCCTTLIRYSNMLQIIEDKPTAWRLDICQTEVVRWHNANQWSSMQLCKGCAHRRSLVWVSVSACRWNRDRSPLRTDIIRSSRFFVDYTIYSRTVVCVSCERYGRHRPLAAHCSHYPIWSSYLHNVRAAAVISYRAALLIDNVGPGQADLLMWQIVRAE